MLTVTLQEARATLPELLHRLMPGEEVSITDNGQIVGRLLPGEPLTGFITRVSNNADDQWPCRAGSAKGKIRIATDFDDPLEDFSEYM